MPFEFEPFTFDQPLIQPSTLRKEGISMKLSRKAGEWSGKLVKGTTAAPTKTTSWAKRFGTDVAEGYRSVVPKVEKTEQEN